MTADVRSALADDAAWFAAHRDAVRRLRKATDAEVAVAGQPVGAYAVAIRPRTKTTVHVVYFPTEHAARFALNYPIERMVPRGC